MKELCPVYFLGSRCIASIVLVGYITIVPQSVQDIAVFSLSEPI